MNEARVAFDAGMIRRLVEAGAGSSAPADPETVAVVRVYLYSGPIVLVPTVLVEMTDEGLTTRTGFGDFQFEQVDADEFYRGCVKGMSERYLDLHPDPRDCHVVAEAECARVRTFVTLKDDLLDGLRGRIESLELRTPSEHWAALGIGPGTEPTRRLPPGHPLREVAWWRW
jgi:hypothetical protein